MFQMARGTGIKVVNKWSQIPKSQPLIVQRYIARPHLINNTKYDLRIYVLMTSLHPLRIYLYDEGLVRFASTEYAPDNDSLGDVYMHLTNYSINKNSSTYCPNEDPDERKGHKWTLGSLWQHFAEIGVDSRAVWEKIRDMVIKTIISGEHSMFPLARANMVSHYCGYELFGFDFLLDADLKPWLIEVNISPSLHSSSPLDLDVKSPLATEVFNIARYHVPNKIPPRGQRQILQKLNMEDMQAPLCLDPRVYTRHLSKGDCAKQARVIDLASGASGPDRWSSVALDRLTPDDVRCLIRTEDELARLTHFQRIFPTQETGRYLRFFQQPRYHNLLMDAWERKYGDCRSAGIDRLERLCQDKVHLRVPQTSSSLSSSAASPSHQAGSSSVAKGIVNVAMLKAPTGTYVAASRSEARPVSEAAEKSASVFPSSSKTAQAKKPSFVAKPQHMSKSSSSSSLAGAKLSLSSKSPSSSSSCSSKSSSPEPMSVDNSEGEEKLDNLSSTGGAKTSSDDNVLNNSSEALISSSTSASSSSSSCANNKCKESLNNLNVGKGWRQ